MTATINSQRGRPRGFDPEAALALGQRLFHQQGYDGVGMAALTQALGIKPPSFYAAFGSKAQFFDKVLGRYCAANLPLEATLRHGRPPAEALGDLLAQAACTYSADPEARGCLVLEAARGDERSESAQLARRSATQRRVQMRDFVARTHRAAADGVTDYVVSTMSGLSACAREGFDVQRLLSIANAAATALPSLLERA